MARKRRDPLADFANSLTPAQVKRLIQIADPLTDEQQEQFNKMSDDELLAALKE